jgi:hypothetical protein
VLPLARLLLRRKEGEVMPHKWLDVPVSVEAVEDDNARVFAAIERSHHRALAVLCVPLVAFLVGLVALVVVVVR